MVDELSDHLMARGYMADKLHGDMPQGGPALGARDE